MFKSLMLVGVLSAGVAHAAAAPKVIFVGDQFMYNWQQSAAFEANPNWIGQGIPDGGGFAESARVAAAFQSALSLHPAIVFIETGSSDIQLQTDSTNIGMEWQFATVAIVQMVQMAKRANVPVILGNAASSGPGYNSDFFNGWLQTYAAAERIPLVNIQTWLQNGCAGVIPAAQEDLFEPCVLLAPNPTGSPEVPVPTNLGYQFITQMAQTAIATYGLSIRGGYLSNEAFNPGNYSTGAQANSVGSGQNVQFTAQAKWSDGVTRPMWNTPYSGAFNTAAAGTWTSSNPKVMAINQQGNAVAYTSGTTNITFRSSSGITFSPWTMTVSAWYDIAEPVY